MASEWPDSLRKRIALFQSRIPKPVPGAYAVSVKVRVSSGCFHREHSPNAYRVIDAYLASVSTKQVEIGFEEHESGPEILVYVGAGTAIVLFAKGVIELVVAILKARSEGIRRGDHPSDPLELVVRRVEKDGEIREEIVLRIGHLDQVEVTEIEGVLNAAVAKLTKRDASNAPEEPPGTNGRSDGNRR